jgi:hypothetical protein
MPIDPDKIRAGKDGTQINVRVSPETKEVIDYLVFVDQYSSQGQLLLNLVGQAIEYAAPSIREALDKPANREIDWPQQVLGALDEVCPPETTPPEK